jgi:hypothetical protein
VIHYKSELHKKGDTVKIEFLGLTENSFNGKHLAFEYRVTIGKENTSYYTGIGHCYTGKKQNENDIRMGDDMFKKLTRTNYNFLSVKTLWDEAQALRKGVYIKFPKFSDIAECLLSDIDAGSCSFNDFCDTFCYSNDSLNALDTYRACMETARKFKKTDLTKYLTDEQKEDLGLN